MVAMHQVQGNGDAEAVSLHINTHTHTHMHTHTHTCTPHTHTHTHTCTPHTHTHTPHTHTCTPHTPHTPHTHHTHMHISAWLTPAHGVCRPKPRWCCSLRMAVCGSTLPATPARPSTGCSHSSRPAVLSPLSNLAGGEWQRRVGWVGRGIGWGKQWTLGREGQQEGGRGGAIGSGRSLCSHTYQLCTYMWAHPRASGVLKTPNQPHCPSLHSCPVSTCAGPKGDHVKFPIDFFEHCVPLTSGDVEVSVRQGSCPQCCCILAIVMLSISRSTIDCN